jgi:hypothetical protein
MCAKLSLPDFDYFFPVSVDTDRVWQLLGEHLPVALQEPGQGPQAMALAAAAVVAAALGFSSNRRNRSNCSSRCSLNIA